MEIPQDVQEQLTDIPGILANLSQKKDEEHFPVSIRICLSGLKCKNTCSSAEFFSEEDRTKLRFPNCEADHGNIYKGIYYDRDGSEQTDTYGLDTRFLVCSWCHVNICGGCYDELYPEKTHKNFNGELRKCLSCQQIVRYGTWI